MEGEDMKEEKGKAVTEEELKTIAEFIESIQYGVVSIIIQYGKIIQIEKSEKVRLK